MTYDPSEPRDEHGMWTALGAGFGDHLGDPDHAQRTIAQVSHTLGYDEKKILYHNEPGPMEATEWGQGAQLEGQYDPAKDHIDVYNTTAESTLAHEIFHGEMFPAMQKDAKLRAMLEDPALAQEGGITQYSNKWWEQVWRGKLRGRDDFGYDAKDHAAGETMAEMSKYDYLTQHPPEGYNGPTRQRFLAEMEGLHPHGWKLYNAVKDAYARRHP